ncbi:MAG: 1-pyrroline-5-carboxylate dehydrogenase [Actinomycetota bacterium]|nr:1-pyrroline-5-carboxylate dehydrogenase [Actinomycetota bacterium]
MDAVTSPPQAVNEPIVDDAPGTPARAELQRRLAELDAQGPIDLPSVIDGEARLAGGAEIAVVQPHAHARVLGVTANATAADAEAAVAAAQAAAPQWRALSFDDRAAVLLKAADLLAGPWRSTLNAATMLGQSKTAYQAEIDAACELIDFWRFNVEFARRLLAEQPVSSRGVWNRLDHRPLEGFVYAVTPFNFTAIAGNLPTAPALMGNTVVWKPAPTQQFAAHYLMALLQEAGLPPGVINMVTGDGIAVSEVALADPNLAGIHFTGSTPVFQLLWRTVGARIGSYRTYPRLVGETGGKDFILAHPSADPAVLTTAMIRGAFEFQGQKCSAASRAYVPRSLWNVMGDDFLDQVNAITQGSVTDFGNFMTAVIDQKSFAKNVAAIERARADETVKVAAGGTYDDSEGYFIRPTVLLGSDPTKEFFSTEYFGPVLAVHVYEDADYQAVMAQLEGIAPYALTGSILAGDRRVIAEATEVLRFAAGNFYINDKPTGAVVGQQPFGGGRASGTNDKAGAMQNLMRWTSTRAIKETFDPPTSYGYPFMT